MLCFSLLALVTIPATNLPAASERSGPTSPDIGALPGVPRGFRLGMSAEELRALRPKATLVLPGGVIRFRKRTDGEPDDRSGNSAVEDMIETVRSSEPLIRHYYRVKHGICVGLDTTWEHNREAFVDQRRHWIQAYVGNLGPSFRRMVCRSPDLRSVLLSGKVVYYDAPLLRWATPAYFIDLTITPDLESTRRDSGTFDLTVLAPGRAVRLDDSPRDYDPKKDKAVYAAIEELLAADALPSLPGPPEDDFRAAGASEPGPGGTQGWHASRGLIAAIAGLAVAVTLAVLVLAQRRRAAGRRSRDSSSQC